MTVLRIELVCDDAALLGLEPEWMALWRRAGATPFQHPAWLLPWWSQFGTGAPRVALLRADDGTLLGLLPLYDLPCEGKSLPIGAGLSDYCDALLDPTAPPDAASTLLAVALSGAALPCHVAELPPDAALRHAAAPPGWRLEEHRGLPCPVLLPDCVPARQRRKLRMARYRAARIGGCEVIADDVSLFADLVRLNEQRWAAGGVLADARVRAFHAAALPALSAAGLLWLRGLRFGARTVAVIYALRSDRRMFLYLSGFDPAHAFESPGTILLGAMIDEAVAEGIAELHFLRGAEAYKYAWGAVDRCNVTRVFEPE